VRNCFSFLLVSFLAGLVALSGCATANGAEVKKVARALLNRLKQLLVLNWRQKAAARSQLKLAIEDALDTGLPRAYPPELYRQKCSAVFEHMYESYPERDAGVYAMAG
jgi:type I restriction enzyme R subunit